MKEVGRGESENASDELRISWNVSALKSFKRRAELVNDLRLYLPLWKGKGRGGCFEGWRSTGKGGRKAGFNIENVEKWIAPSISTKSRSADYFFKKRRRKNVLVLQKGCAISSSLDSKTRGQSQGISWAKGTVLWVRQGPWMDMAWGGMKSKSSQDKHKIASPPLLLSGHHSFSQY